MKIKSLKKVEEISKQQQLLIKGGNSNIIIGDVIGS